VTAEYVPSVIAPLGSVARKTYKVTIFEALHELIQNLDLPPGERLVEADLATRFGISKTPVREALLLLERERLVTAVPHVGATVTWLSFPDYEQKLFILDALEQPTLQLIHERITRAELESCRQIVDRMSQAFAHNEEPAYLGHVIQMHSQLFAAARYPQLTELVNGMQQSLRRYTKAFVHHYTDNWKREFETAQKRFAHLYEGDVPSAAAAVQQGHKALLEFARERVAARDPDVIRYLDPSSLDAPAGLRSEPGVAVG
jgi:DNA-binding GntR family transcriptional regulator